jgi:hypothetical protein
VLQGAQYPLEIDEADRVAGVASAIGEIGRDIDDALRSPAAHPLTCFVRGDRHEPGTDLLWVPERADPSPRDRPRRLHRVAGHLGVPADDVRDARHRGVVLGDETGERDFVASGGRPDRRLDRRRVTQCDARHVR